MQQQKSVGRGIRLTVAGTIVAVSVQALVTVVLLRLLTPSDYAQYAIAALVGAFSTQAAMSVLERAAMLMPDEDGLGGAGLSVGLVVLGSAGVALAVVALLSGLGLVAAPIGIVATLLAGHVATGFAVTPRALLRRRMRYGPIVGAEVAAQVVGTGLITVLLAAAGLGAYAIVIGGAAGSIITLATTLIVTGREAFWPVRVTGLRPLAARAIRVLETSLVETSILQIPVMVVSSLGATVLGLFNRAMNIVQLPVQMVASAISRVLVAELVRNASDPDAFRETARRMLVLATATLFPICAGIAGAAHEFTAVVMGPQWIGAEQALPYLAITAAEMLVAGLLGLIADAAGQLRAKSRLLMGAAAILLASALAALPLGLVGVAVALMLANLVQVAMLIGLVSGKTRTGTLRMLRWLSPGIVAGAICFAWSRLVSMWLNQPDAVVLGTQVLGCAVVVAAYYLIWHRPMVRELVGLLRG